MYIPGDIYYKQFVTNNISGVSQNADTVPWGVLNRNGVDDTSAGAKVFISNIDVGRYNVSGVVPSTYGVGNSINVTVSGVIGGNPTKSVFDLGMVGPVQHGLGYAVENGVSASQLFSAMGAAIAGSSTVNGNIITYYAVNNNATTRITATAISGARQSILLNLP